MHTHNYKKKIHHFFFQCLLNMSINLFITFILIQKFLLDMRHT